MGRVKGMIIATVVTVTFFIIVFCGACSNDENHPRENAGLSRAFWRNDGKPSQSSNAICPADSIEPKGQVVVKTNIVAVLPDIADLPVLFDKDRSDAEKLAKEQAERDLEKSDAMAALFAINHINWVVTKIKTYNDPAVLEEEYRDLTVDSLNLRVIKDPEVIDTICRILDVIVEMRIEARERDFLKEELDQGMSDAFADAASGVTVSGSNPVSMIASAITSVATAALNYRKAKRALQKKFKRQSWELDKNRMYYLNDLNKDLLRNFWSIVQKYPDLPDEYRVSEKNIQLLVDHLKDEDAKKRHEFLEAFEDQFAGFQPYWYHRAVAAYEVWSDDTLDIDTRNKAKADARFSIERYMAIQIVCGNILRKDSTSSKAALLRAAILSEDGSKDRKAFQEAIDIAVRNSAADDWQVAYFCAMVAVRELNDIPQAKKILAPVVSELDWQRRRRLVDWKDEMQTRFELKSDGKVGDLFPSGDALYECRTLIARAAKLSDDDYREQVAGICNDQNASVREKLFCYGAMGYRQALDSLLPDLRNIVVYINHEARKGRYLVSVPFSWVIARDARMTLEINGKGKDEEGERDIEVREDGRQYVLMDFGDVNPTAGSLRLRSRFDRGSGKREYDNIHYMLELEFEMEGGNFKPRRARFGQWEIGDTETASHWRMADPKDGAEPKSDVTTIDL